MLLTTKGTKSTKFRIIELKPSCAPLKIGGWQLLHPSSVLPIKGRIEPSPSTGEGWIGVSVLRLMLRDGFHFHPL